MPEIAESTCPRILEARVRALARPAARAFALALVVANVGCIGPIFRDRDNFLLNPDIQATDHDVVIPSVRASWESDPQARARQVGLYEILSPIAPTPTPSTPAAPATTEPSVATPNATSDQKKRRRSFQLMLGLDAEYAVGLGGRDNRPTPGTVRYEGVVLSGVPDLRFDYDLHVASIGGRVGFRVKDFLSLGALAGLSASTLRLQLADATQSVSETATSLGGHIGARITISPHPVFDIVGESKLHMMDGLTTDRRFVFVPTALVVGQLHLTRNVSTFAGYRWWRYQENIDSGSDIDDFVMEGPTMGLTIRF